jgi:hypothetical protein
VGDDRDVRDIADRMSERDWQSLTVQLGRYALQKSRRFYWRTGSSGELPTANGPNHSSRRRSCCG